MKKILIMTAFALCLIALNNIANASTCNLQRCVSSVAGDAGHSSTKCVSPGGVDGCTCTTAATGCSNVVIGTIPGGYHLLGYLGVGGTGICAGTGGGCILKDNKLINPETQEVIETSAAAEAAGLSQAFVPNMDNSRANTYYGVVDNVNRSPSNGRTSDPMAKLDACLFHTDVTAIDATVGTADDKHHACVGASIGCGTTLKNEYCQASGTNDGATVSAAVCKDRCDCIYTGAEGSVCGGN
jgi:hypothetical protein